jgi:hypothetical protein
VKRGKAFLGWASRPPAAMPDSYCWVRGRIGDTITTTEQLRAALDALDSTNNNVIVSETAGATRFDVHIKRSLSTQTKGHPLQQGLILPTFDDPADVLHADEAALRGANSHLLELFDELAIDRMESVHSASL